MDYREDNTLGAELKSRREALGMAVDDLARATHLSARYISALEKSDYTIFPAKVYAQGAVRRIAQIFADGDRDMLIALLNREWPMEQNDCRCHTAQWCAPFLLGKILPIRRKVGALAAGAFFIFVLGFWGVRLFFFATPPVLVVTLPEPQSRITAPTATVAGTTERESRLTVNGREIRIDERGAFREDIELPLGTNRLQFISESRFGKTSTEVRYILVE